MYKDGSILEVTNAKRAPSFDIATLRHLVALFTGEIVPFLMSNTLIVLSIATKTAALPSSVTLGLEIVCRLESVILPAPFVADFEIVTPFTPVKS